MTRFASSILSLVLSTQIAIAAGQGTLRAETSGAQVKLDIAAQPLTEALHEFAYQSGLQLVFEAEDVRPDLRSPRLVGLYEAESALAQLLEKSGLVYKYINAHTVAIREGNATSAAKEIATRAADPDLILAQAPQTSTDTSGAAASASADESGEPLAKVEEIVVTAQKRIERLQDVPVPVTAISGESLVNNNQLRLEDYYSKVPGLNLTPGFYGPPVIAIRGITAAGFANPTVAIMVDDVPYGPSTAVGGGTLTPDFDPSDLARLEILRGPQGTLYGASSLGGLLKYATLDPELGTLNGRLQTGISSIKNGDEAGYSIRGAMNIPLNESWAIRASGFTRSDPGYIDAPGFLFDPSRHEDGVNSGEAEGGRIAALWKPTEDLTLKLAAFVQNDKHDARSTINLGEGSGDLEQSALRRSGWYNNRSRVFSANLNAKVGDVDLVAISGYSINRTSGNVDFTPSFLFDTGTPDTFGVSGTSQNLSGETKKFTQELRLTSSLGQGIDWLAGAFYTDEDSENSSDLLAVDTVTLDTAGSWFHLFEPNTFKEYAGFADVTFHVTSRFDIQVGGRQSWNKQSYAQRVVGPYAARFLGADPFVVDTINSKDKAFTYLLTPQLKLSSDLMVYGRFASGYRPGGPNLNGVAAVGAPATFDPDTTRNYELGAKGNVFGQLLSFDASLYYIDWRDIQLNLYSSECFCGYFANAGGAKSQGAELSVEVRPMTGLTVSAWGAYNDAVLTKGFPEISLAAFGDKGDRLPFSSRVSANLAVDQQFPLGASWRGFVGASITYVGDRDGEFKAAADAVRVNFPSYTQGDVRAGLRRDSWSVNAFVTNVADKRGLLSGDPRSDSVFYFIRPRTIGVSLAKTFGN
jgi:outer membrane receptor protein involved in Fe transport